MWIQDLEEFILEVEQVEAKEEAERLKEAQKMVKKFKIQPHNYVRELKQPLDKQEIQ